METKIRTAVFGSLYGGTHLLKFLSSEKLADTINIVGVATDDPTKPFTHPHVRLWRYAHTHEEEFMVREHAASLGLPVYTGSVQSTQFQRIFQTCWKPQLCLMATFGQKIPPSLYKFPRLGFYNFHHSAKQWPSYPGPTPIEEMVRDGKSHLVLTMHEVSRTIDDGNLIAHSQEFPIARDVDAIKMHARTWPHMEDFVTGEVQKIVDSYKGPLPLIPLELEKISLSI